MTEGVDDGTNDEDSDMFEYPAGFAASFDALDEDDENYMSRVHEEAEEGHGDWAADDGAGVGEEEGQALGVLSLSETSEAGKMQVKRWLRRLSLSMPEAGPMNLDSGDEGKYKEGGWAGLKPGSRTVSNKSLGRTISEKTISQRAISQKSVSRASLFSARSFSSKASVAESIISAVGGRRAARPVVRSSEGALTSDEAIEEYVMSQAAKRIDEKTLVTRRSEFGRFLTTRFLRATRLPARMLDKVKDSTKILLSQSRPALPSTTLMALFSKNWFVVFLLAISAMRIWRGAHGAWAQYARFQFLEFDQVRFTPTGHHTPQPLSVALMLDGCPIKNPSHVWVLDEAPGRGLSLSLDHKISANGWCVRWPAKVGGDGEESHADDAMYRLEGRAGDGEWHSFGASGWTLVQGMFEELPTAPNVQKHVEEVRCIDATSHQWMWLANIVLSPLIQGAVILAALVNGRFFRYQV